MKVNEKIDQMQSPSATWQRLFTTARHVAEEHALFPKVRDIILSSQNLSDAAAKILAEKIQDHDIGTEKIKILFQSIHDHDLENTLSMDLESFEKNDPAIDNVLIPFLFYKGFHALLGYRLAHALWASGDHLTASHIQSRVSALFGVDIHPAAQLGKGIMMDHATGIVIGATAVVGDHVLFWHGVTLGGKGYDEGDRHPKIGNHVSLGAMSTLLGNIKIGDHAKIGAGSVVVHDVPENTTVVGIPAKKI